MIKLLLYCTKAKPYIMKYKDGKYKEIASFYNKQDLATYDLLNGKIVAECDFIVFDIHPCASYKGGLEYGSNCMWATFINEEDLLNKSCLTMEELNKYLASNKSSGYGIGIKNLHIFDEPKELRDYYSQNQVDFIEETELWRLKNGITTAPQNMCYAYKYSYSKSELEKYIIISIQPQWLCKILNGEKTIEVRKKVLKEMLR